MRVVPTALKIMLGRGERVEIRGAQLEVFGSSMGEQCGEDLGADGAGATEY